MEHHPDKNRGKPESVDRFREVHEAYETLLREKPTGERTQAEMLQDMVTKLMGGTVPLEFATKLLDVMAVRFESAWRILLRGMHDDALALLHTISTKYSGGTMPGYIQDIAGELQNRNACARSACVHYVLRPDLSHLLDQECFMLDHEGETFCVPLWYPEAAYKANGHTVVVRCQPRLPDHIDIDQRDAVHVSVTVDDAALAKGSIDVPLGQRHLRVSARCVTGDYTSHVFKGKGIPRTTGAPTLAVTRGDVVVHVTRRTTA